MDQVFNLKNKTKPLKNIGKWEQILGRSGNFVSHEKWEAMLESPSKNSPGQFYSKTCCCQNLEMIKRVRCKENGESPKF